MPSMSGTWPISIKSIMPFAVLGLRYSSKYLALREKPLPKSENCGVFIAEKYLVTSYLIYSAVKCDFGRQMLVNYGWLFIRLIE
jgi:hypothetical protein